MTAWNATASAPHTARPRGAAGRAPCQPTPFPAAKATTTMPPSARILAVVTTFCTQRPVATRVRLIAVNRTTNAGPRRETRDGADHERRARPERLARIHVLAAGSGEACGELGEDQRSEKGQGSTNTH